MGNLCLFSDTITVGGTSASFNTGGATNINIGNPTATTTIYGTLTLANATIVGTLNIKPPVGGTLNPMYQQVRARI